MKDTRYRVTWFQVTLNTQFPYEFVNVSRGKSRGKRRDSRKLNLTITPSLTIYTFVLMNYIYLKTSVRYFNSTDPTLGQ